MICLCAYNINIHIFIYINISIYIRYTFGSRLIHTWLTDGFFWYISTHSCQRSSLLFYRCICPTSHCSTLHQILPMSFMQVYYMMISFSSILLCKIRVLFYHFLHNKKVSAFFFQSFTIAGKMHCISSCIMIK